MKKSSIPVIAVAAVGIFSAAAAFAQPPGPPEGVAPYSAGAPHASVFSPGNMETVSGEVLSVDRGAPGGETTGGPGMMNAVDLLLKTDTGVVSVQLGPSWYVDHQDAEIVPGDTVTVTGARITFGGGPALIATSVKTGDQTLELRDAQGFPLWRGGPHQ